MIYMSHFIMKFVKANLSPSRLLTEKEVEGEETLLFSFEVEIAGWFTSRLLEAPSGGVL